MKVVRLMLKVFSGSFRAVYFLFALVFIFLSAYVLGGYQFLVGGALGSDMGMALSMASWIDKYFPNVPFWYPLAGGGVSFTHSYPVFSFYLVVFLERLTSLGLVESFRVIGYLSVLVMALSIYFFVVFRFKNQTAALIASFLYLVSPICWVWLFDWGFFADNVSHMFVVPAIFFWDLFFVSSLKKKGFFRGLFLALTVIFVSLATLSHYMTGIGVLFFFGFYLLGYTLKAKEKRKTLITGIVAYGPVLVFTVAIVFFAIFPYYRYAQIAQGMRTTSYEAFKNTKMVIDHILGFRVLTEDFVAARNISFPFAVSLLSLLGVIVSFRKRRLLSFVFYCMFALTVPFIPDVLYWASKNLPGPLFFGVFERRPNLTLLRFVLPVLAALGAVEIFKLPFIGFKGRYVKGLVGISASLFGAALVVYCLYYFAGFPNIINVPFKYGARGIDPENIWQVPKSFCVFEDLEETCYELKTNACLKVNRCLGDEKCIEDFKASVMSDWCYSPLSSHFLPMGVKLWCEEIEKHGLPDYGLCVPDLITLEKVKEVYSKCEEDKNFSSICKLAFDPVEKQLRFANWPEFLISTSIGVDGELDGILSRISGVNSSARVDFSPYIGRYVMWAPHLNRDRELSQLSIYAVASTLIRNSWSQLVGVYYTGNPVHGGTVETLNNLTRWFGINYVFFNERTDPELFREAGWSLFEGTWKKGVLEYPRENGLAELSSKPAVLVIGQDSVDSYLQVYRLGNHGAFPYDDAILVWGKGTVDSYDISDLKGFDAVLLHGYTYKNQKNTDLLLEKYVLEGGSLFIDTGWQYTVPDWETKENLKALEVIPFERLSWEDLGKTNAFVLGESEIKIEINAADFSPLIYGDDSWSVSTSKGINLKDWARPVLEVNDYPLVAAGRLGKGKVVWSGMNLFPHIKWGGKVNHKELMFTKNLFSWLVEDKIKKDFSVSYKRDNPDRVEFILNERAENNSFLIWKESYHPDFKAILVPESGGRKELEIFKTGPGFVLIKVPEAESGSKIIYEYEKPFVERAALFLSVGFFVLLIFIALEGMVLRKKSLFLRLTKAVEEKISLFLKVPGKGFLDEEG